MTEDIYSPLEANLPEVPPPSPGRGELVGPTPKSEDTLLSHFDIETIGDEIAKCHFSVREEIRLLIRIMRDKTASYQHKLVAQRQYRLLVRELLELGGYILTGSEKRHKELPDGTTSTQHLSSRILPHTRNSPFGQRANPAASRTYAPTADGTRPSPDGGNLPAGGGTADRGASQPDDSGSHQASPQD